jgi:hypothetical protein
VTLRTMRSRIRDRTHFVESVLTSFLPSFDDYRPSDYTEGSPAVKYFSAKVSVGRGADSFPQKGQCTMDGVGAPSCAFVN